MFPIDFGFSRVKVKVTVTVIAALGGACPVLQKPFVHFNYALILSQGKITFVYETCTNITRKGKCLKYNPLLEYQSEA